MKEDSHLGCMTAVVLSYTTIDISACMLLLYVVAAYHHIYYINVSWYQTQISKVRRVFKRFRFHIKTYQL